MVVQHKHWSEPDQAAIREQLERILLSGPFHQSHRRQRFLEYIVTETLAGRGERLKGYNVALAVFDRPQTFDPHLDPIVRIEAARGMRETFLKFDLIEPALARRGRRNLARRRVACESLDVAAPRARRASVP